VEICERALVAPQTNRRHSARISSRRSRALGTVFLGDTTWLGGGVDRRESEHGCEVDLDILCENQRGVWTSPGNATALLPSKRRGPVMLPVPWARTLEEAVQSEIDRLAHLR
jgi:hypothetical protein